MLEQAATKAVKGDIFLSRRICTATSTAPMTMLETMAAKRLTLCSKTTKATSGPKLSANQRASRPKRCTRVPSSAIGIG